ncbi:MAG: RNA-binding transcriptional accessory protein [Bdellovibrionaceae bacterium]|nr:RNA-binding transcriptional accessory protein [Pseudobdellovibrionaceae bacterium]
MSQYEFTPELHSYLTKRVPGVSERSIKAVLELVAEGATVPFIARYRKEKTGNLDEVQIRDLIKETDTHAEIVKRKDFILTEVAKQGNLTDELEKQINASFELAELEELYRPFKRKKKTKATLAREAGLGPLADWIWQLGQGEIQDTTALEVKAKEFINTEAGFVTYDEVLRGAQHIIVEKLSNIADLRTLVRDDFHKHGQVKSSATPKFKANSKFEMYKDFTEDVTKIQSSKASHRYLAIRRGWQDGELKVSLDTPNEESLLRAFEAHCLKTDNAVVAPFLKNAAKHALTVHVIPSITNELHRILKDLADEHAIGVFAENLRRVLMSSPFGSKVVLGIDPGLRTGCKVALVDKSGHFISHTVMYTQGEGAKDKAKRLFEEVFKQLQISAIAVGNGTAGRETESFVREVLKDLKIECPVVMVNESGASVYSASDIAREEFPDLDLTIRGAISIARRLQDPLAELVKIDPKSIGVGQYQHDVSQPSLKKSLHEVVESCVNDVGVDVNTASESLLQYVAGIGPSTAKNIIEFRKTNGLFDDRDQLLKVSRFSAKTFEQSAGFLRVLTSKSPLDKTGVHPERYQAVKDMAQDLGVTVSKLMGEGAAQLAPLREKWVKLVGEYTFDDIVKELSQPGRDPRDPFKVFQFREDIHEIKDLQKDMVCPGIVTNVTNFGAFVDIGVHQDGLVHISELSHEFVDDPKKVVSPGDQVKVKVLEADLDKNQISLTMLLTEKPKTAVKGKSQGKRAAGDKGGPRKGAGRKGKRPPGRGGDSRRQGGARGGRGEGRPKSAFNNPFAALADLNNKK